MVRYPKTEYEWKEVAAKFSSNFGRYIQSIPQAFVSQLGVFLGEVEQPQVFETRACFFCCTVTSSSLDSSLWVSRSPCSGSAVTSTLYVDDWGTYLSQQSLSPDCRDVAFSASLFLVLDSASKFCLFAVKLWIGEVWPRIPLYTYTPALTLS